MNTRQKILDYLSSNGPSKVSEIAIKLDLTVADVRYQLKRLITESKVEPLERLQGSMRGRPALKFAAVSQLPQKAAVVLLEMWTNLLLTEFPGLSYQEIAKKIWEVVKIEMDLSLVPIQRMNQILILLNSLGVAAHWLAGKHGPTVRIDRNPYTMKVNPRPFEMIADLLVQVIIKDLSPT